MQNTVSDPRMALFTRQVTASVSHKFGGVGFAFIIRKRLAETQSIDPAQLRYVFHIRLGGSKPLAVLP